MTRFARARGSKSSNAREPEDATEWSVLKRQLKEKQAESSANEVNEVRQSFTRVSSEDKNETTWADFGTPKAHVNKLKKRTNKASEGKNGCSVEAEDELCSKDKKSKKKIREKQSDTLLPATEEGANLITPKKKKKLKDTSCTSLPSTNHDTAGSPSFKKESETHDSAPLDSKMTYPNFTKKISCPENVRTNGTNNGKKNSNKRKWLGTAADGVNSAESQNDGAYNANQPQQYKRRKPYIESTTISVNGLTINVSKFDGFDVKTEDAERLKELKKRMFQEGVPRAQVDKVIKLERRRAEKVLSREKKKVCFNCRKAGHLLSECPEVGGSGSKNWDSTSTGLCYKCGSTEHTHFQCRVQKKQEYRFAKCFICQEQGHISSQCPDNPKGLYPEGGCCKVCGEVTHLKKDCPKLAQERTDNTITIDTLESNRNLESLEEDKISKPSSQSPLKKKKVVKF